MKAIPTRYKGYHFRSRLEARWAVFFETLGLKWEYEPEGFVLPNGEYYLPDFRVHYPGKSVWFEVKGGRDHISEAEWSKMTAFGDANGLILLDDVPDVQMYLFPLTVTEVPYSTQVKEIVKLLTGVEMKTAIRTMSKLLALISDEELAEALRLTIDGDFDRLNLLIKQYFVLHLERLSKFDRHGPSLWRDEDHFFCDQSLLQSACDAARSARFEHGSCGPPNPHPPTTPNSTANRK